MERDPKFENLRVVSVKSCTPGYAEHDATGEKIAILRLMSCSTPQEPLMLSIFDAKKLMVALVDVLAFHQIDLPPELRDAIIFSSPAGQPARKITRPATVPSRRANMPTGPIQSDEVMKFMAGLALVNTWPALVKHVGAKNTSQVGKSKPRRKKGKGRNDK